MNRALRAHVLPVLRSADFTKLDARNGWSWQDKMVWVFNIRAVGSYFSSVTGWPPGSVCVWLGVYYLFIPQKPHVKTDEQGRLLPAEHMCHMRSHLECTLDQIALTGRLPNPAERLRKDIWWVEPGGEDAPLVAANIASALGEKGLPWFRACSDLRRTLKEIEASHNCFVKFDTAALLARELGDTEKLRTYAELAVAEGRRIGRSVDPKGRYGAGG